MKPREVSFEQDVQHLFRERDRSSMSSKFDLWSYNDVVNWSDAIRSRLRDGSMPCDGAWPEQQVARFEDWALRGEACLDVELGEPRSGDRVSTVRRKLPEAPP